MANIVTNLFGDIALDTSIKFLKNIISRFTFDSSGQLRVGGSVGVSSLPTLSTVTTVTTITQSNTSFGDMGKTSAAQLVSQQNFMCGNRRNFA